MPGLNFGSEIINTAAQRSLKDPFLKKPNPKLLAFLHLRSLSKEQLLVC